MPHWWAPTGGTHGEALCRHRRRHGRHGRPGDDLTASSTALFTRAGVEGTKKYFLHLKAGQSPNHPNGVEDNTHFQASGAIEVARLVATALRDQKVLPSGSFRQLTSAVPPSAIVWP